MSNKLFGNAAIYLGANILNAGIPFLLLPVLTRVLTPADYGIVAMFGIVVSILGAFTGLSVHGAVGVRYFQLDSGKLAEYVGTCLAILFVSTALVLGIVAIGGSWLERVTQIPADWLLAVVLMSGAQFVINLRLSLWLVQHKAARYGAFQVSQSLVNVGFSLYFVVVLGMAWQGRLIGQMIAVMLFMLLSLYWLVRSKEFAIPSAPRDDAVDALKFGVPLIPHVIGGLLIVATDRFMITNLLDISQAGIYMVALQLGQALGLLTDSFNRSYAPWLMGQLGKPDTARDRNIVRGTYLYFVIVTLLACVLGVLAPWVLSFLVGEKFRGVAPIVIYVAMGYAFGGMYYMVTNYIFFASKTAYLAWITLLSGLFNVVATYVLIKANGLPGAAQAFMLSQAMIFLGTWLLAHKVRPMPWKQAMMPLRS